MELYKLELVALIHEMYDVNYPQAWAMWSAASAVYSDRMYQLMMHLLKHNNMYISIDRNPSKRNKNAVAA